MRAPALSFRRFPRAAVVFANFAQFNPSQTIQHPRVESRMMLWCEAGTGTVTAGKNAYAFEPGRCLFLPWRHAVRYEASAGDPFLVGGVHIIPDHLPAHPLSFTVAHNASHPLANAPYRRDVSIPELPGLTQGWLVPASPLVHLLKTIVQTFVRGDPEEWQARQFAQQLLNEWIFSRRRREIYGHAVPPELERIKQHILWNLSRPMSLRDLVEFSKLSPSTIGRMFRKHLGTTPVEWITRAKIERAKSLLRTRRISALEVGGQIGIPDPYYFSKCFKKVTRQSPKQYQQKTTLM